MTYIDCYLVPVLIANKAGYERLARVSAQVVMEYGALRVFECWLDASGPEAASYHGLDVRLPTEAYASFAAVAGVNAGETLVLSCVEWPDKASRDQGMAKVTSDARMQFHDQPAVFDGRRLISAGFIPMLLQEKNDQR